MLASLPSALVIAAIVAAALFVFKRFSALHPNPVARMRAEEEKQGASILALACIVLSAAIPLACFMSVGADYPVLDYVDARSIDSSPLAVTIAAYILVCVAVGFYEEGAFRVILQDLFTRGFSSNGARPERCALYAALLTSVLFAALHAASPLPAGGDSTQIALQVILKFLQGTLFGLAMAGLLAKTGSFALIVAVHTSYDLLFFLPWAISAGTFPSTYLTGLPIDTLALCANCVCLVPSAVVGIRQLVCGGAVQRRMG